MRDYWISKPVRDFQAFFWEVAEETTIDEYGVVYELMIMHFFPFCLQMRWTAYRKLILFSKTEGQLCVNSYIYIIHAI